MGNQFVFGKLRGHTNGHTYVGGIYNGELFEGTDKLSMAVQPDAVAFVRRRAGQPGTLVLEGDRLANAKFLKSMYDFGPGVETHLVVLSTPPDDLLHRHKTRGDNQTERWLSSRKTKVQNLVEAARQMPHVILHAWEHQTQEQSEYHANLLLALTLSSPD